MRSQTGTEWARNAWFEHELGTDSCTFDARRRILFLGPWCTKAKRSEPAFHEQSIGPLYLKILDALEGCNFWKSFDDLSLSLLGRGSYLGNGSEHTGWELLLTSKRTAPRMNDLHRRGRFGSRIRFPLALQISP